MASSVGPKYPPDSTVTKLTSTYEIKRTWLYNEWDPKCQFHGAIQPSFPDRAALTPALAQANTQLVEAVFQHVRGRFVLWQAPREEGRWKKVEVAALPIDWVEKNVHVPYPSADRFPVSELSGLVLWKSAAPNGKKYQLYEGNHRVSTWLATRTPETLPATLYIGKPKREIPKTAILV